MSDREKLDEGNINDKVAHCEGWSYVDGALHAEYVFKNFQQAFSFMTQAAFVSEKLNHHPNWTNVYKTVTIDLSTHDAGGVTELDFKWVSAVIDIYNEYR